MKKAIYRANDQMSNWLSEFADNFSKEATTPMRSDISSQISEIVSGVRKSTPYATVSEAVEDYKKRIGLCDYKHRVTAQKILEETDAEMASEEKKNPEIIERFPEIGTFISNLAMSQYGIQLPAILNSILEVFSRHVTESDLDDPDLIRYINNVLIENYRPDSPMPSNLGKPTDLGSEPFVSDNPLGILQPNKQWR